MIILVTGGSRSGKSAHALRLAESQPGPWRFIATCPAIDEEMAKKIEAHKLERDARTWTTIEEEIDLAGAIAQAGAAGVITVICVTNEVGLGIVPPDASTRLYRNLVGRCGQAIVAASDVAVMVVCGMPITLKGDPEK